MSINSRQSVLIGAAAGLGVAVLTLLLAALNSGPDANECVSQTVNFLASIPLALLNIPQILLNILFFAYWALVGALMGWLLSQKNKSSKLAALALLAGLIISHWLTKLRIERELEAIMNGLSEWLKGGLTR